MRTITNVRFMALVITAAAAMLVSGCARQSPSQLSARYTAARNIQDTDDRDRAMDRLAMDAVRAGDKRMAMDATRAISDNSRRDRVARASAEILDARGDRAAAQEFVQVITDTDLRDRMNKSFASEPPKPAPQNK